MPLHLRSVVNIFLCYNISLYKHMANFSKKFFFQLLSKYNRFFRQFRAHNVLAVLRMFFLYDEMMIYSIIAFYCIDSRQIFFPLFYLDCPINIS